MEISKSQTPNGLTYYLSGRFDAHEVPRLKAELEPLTVDFTLDLQNVNFIDSSGLALLVSIYKKSMEAGIQMAMISVQDTVRAILEVTKLDMVLPLESLQAA